MKDDDWVERFILDAVKILNPCSVYITYSATEDVDELQNLTESKIYERKLEL